MKVYDRIAAPAELKGFRDLLETLEGNGKAEDSSVLVEGASGSGIDHILALVAHKTGRDMLVVVPDSKIAERTAANLVMLSRILGDPDRGIAYLPYIDVEPYSEMTPHLRVRIDRAIAFSSMVISERGKVLLTTPENLIFPAPPKHEISSRILRIKTGEEAARNEVIRMLEGGCYERVSLVETPGEYSVRGGIIDFYSPLYRAPCRIEYDGDVIDSIRFFDPTNQLSIEQVEGCTIAPINEIFAAPEKRIEDYKFKKSDRRPSTDFFRYASLFDKPASVIDYLDDPVVVHFNAKEEVSMLNEMRRAYRSRFREIDSQSDADCPDTLLFSKEYLSKSMDGSPALFFTHYDDSKPVKKIEIRVSSPPLTQDGVLSSEIYLRDIRSKIKKGRIATFFGGNQAKAEILNEYPEFKKIKALLISAGKESGGEDRFKIEGVPLAKNATTSHADIYEVEVKDNPVIIPTRFFKGHLFHDIDLEFIGSESLFSLASFPRRKKKKRIFTFDLEDLKINDYVVHYEHGVGTYRGLRTLTVDDVLQEFVIIEYAGMETLYVPVTNLDFLDRYHGPEGLQPKIDSLGSKKWVTRRGKIKKSIENLTRALLNLYASRQLIRGHAFSPDTNLQAEIESLFPYMETEDQIATIEDVKKDMEIPKPMDRIIIGDVGFGKTEVAIRAAFKAVMDGKQVAVLTPTTVLAFQHFRNFSERMEGFNVDVAMLSRLVPKTQQREVIDQIASGEVDIIIGTHRILSKDLKFKNLSLLIVDEEQRFGVSHKERLKMLKHQIDVLTLTATPIPRTLSLAMAGIRDMSLIETPPENRLSVKTEITRSDDNLLREALEREVSRGGQVYFVHNSIDTIDLITERLRRFLPNARFTVAHGRMKEKELEAVMVDFIQGESDILVSTTIIENGLDIPNVNTLVVNNAHKFGLSQLYQLRGRVGRSSRQAYCYLLIPPYSRLSQDAKKRLETLIEFSRLGSGFRIAAMDMELRGSGNILGSEQSGQVAEVGFDLYCKMLDQAVAEMKGEEPIPQEREISIELQIRIVIPDDYISDPNQRLSLYRRVSSTVSLKDLEKLREEILDRYGPAPSELDNLFAYGRLKLAAGEMGIGKIGKDGENLVVKIEKSTPLGPSEILNLINSFDGSRFLPDGRILLKTGSVKDLLIFAEQCVNQLKNLHAERSRESD